MPAILALFIQYLPALIQGTPKVIAYIQQMRAIFKSHNLWTPEHEAELMALSQQYMDNPPDWLKTDEQLGQQ